MKLRPSLLMLTAAAAGVSAVANALTAATPAPPPPAAAEQTRLGVSIQQDLTARDQEAARRARAIELREQAAKAAEQRLQAAGGGGARGGARRSPAAPAGVPESEDERYTELARIYQAMKPKPAAIVFEQLAMDVQVEVAQRMRERSTAAVLAAMTPKGAAALTMAIARRQTAIAPALPSPAPTAAPAAAGPQAPAR